MIANSDNLPELAKGWKWADLTEACEIILGQSPPSSTYNENGNGLPFYQGKLEFGEIYPTPRKWCSAPKKIAEKGDVLISVRAPVGPTNICPDKSCIGRGLAAIRGLGGIPTLFVIYLMRAFEQKLTGQGTGTTFNAITGNQLKDFSVPLPEQKRIVVKIEELFTKLDAGVEALKKIQAQLKRYRQAVLKHAFEGKLTAEWRNAHKGELESASKLLERIAKEREKHTKGKKQKKLPQTDISNLPGLPDGWAWAITSNVCSSVRDGTHDTPKYVEKGVPLVTSKNLKPYGLDFKTTRNISIADHKQISIRSGVQRGDILFAMIGTIGNPVLIDTDMAFSIKNVGLFKKNPTVIASKYLNFWLGSRVFTQLLEKLQLVKGTTQRFVPLGHLRILPVPMTSLLEQKAIVEEIERHFSVADQIEQTIEQGLKQSGRLRQSILKKAFEGKLVPQDPEDEPAEKLLERIKAEKAKLQMSRNTKKCSRNSY